MPMCEVTVESRTRVTENGRTVLYEKKYRGVLAENGKVRLRAYLEKRMPLAETQLTTLPESANSMKDAA